MKKILLTMLMVAFMVCPAMATSLRQLQVNFVDEFGDPITTITSITVFNSGLGTSPTIFSDRAGNITVTNPITTGSTNSTFDQSLGLVRWFQQKPTYKLTVTDGTKTLTIDSRNELDTRFAWYDNYIGTAASLSVLDNESITVGTDSDMVLAWNNGSDFMSWIPASDGSAFNLGTSGTAKNVDFNWYVGSALGIKGDEGNATLIIDGVDVSINVTGSKDTSIASSTATGSVTIGSSTSGTLALDTTAGMTINADDSIAVTTTGAGANITIDAILGSILIDSGENAALAISLITNTGTAETIKVTNTQGTSVTEGAAAIELLAIAGGVELRSTANLANAVAITADSGTTTSILIFNDTGTSATDGSASIQISSDLGGVEILSGLAAANAIRFNATGTVSGDAVVLETTDGGILLNADGGTNGDIELNSADNTLFTSAGDLTFAVTGTLTMGGSAVDNTLMTVELEPSTSEDVLAADSGRTFVNTAAQGVTTFTLPDAAAGLWYVFVDNSSSAADDVIIDCQIGDNIDHDTNGDAIESVTDAYPQTIMLIALNGTDWATFGKIGTWGQQ